MNVTRIFDLLDHINERFPDKADVLAGKPEKDWKRFSISDYRDIADQVSYGLMALGVGNGDRIATISNNRPEWNFLDMGILQAGAVHVPVYPTISESDYQYILNHAEVKFVFVEGKELLSKISHILPQVPSLRGIFTFRPFEGARQFSQLLDLGKANADPGKLDNIRQQIEPEDLATIIYTSGTTGNPKGVMLTHKNIVSNVKSLSPVFPLDETCRALSYLPLSHVYERTNIYIYHYLGVSVYYAENLGKIVDNMREVKPHVLATVPRFMEKVFDRIIDKGKKLSGLKRSIFFRAVNLGLKYDIDASENWYYKLRLKLANKLVFNKWREALGGNIRLIVSGGAALQPRLGKVFTAAEIPVLEGYGLTETSPVIAVSHFGKNGRKFGTVGPPVRDVQVRIADDGEILCKGPNVMKGYYRDEKLTREAIDDDGWFHTGDIGQLEPEGQLRITGRKKSIFKTAMGKYISPEHIENKFKESPLIDNILVVGENQKFAAALIVPDLEHLKGLTGKKNFATGKDQGLINDMDVKKRFQKEVAKFNRHFGKTEQIMKFSILAEEWSVESGELTASLKLRRNFICEKYKDVVQGMFVSQQV